MTDNTYPFEVRFPTDETWKAHWAPPNVRELEDPLYLMQRMTADSYYTTALAGYNRSPHLHAPTGKLWARCSATMESDCDRLHALLELRHGIRFTDNQTDTLYARLLPYFDGTVTAQDFIRPDALQHIESKLPDRKARYGKHTAWQSELHERGTVVQRLLRLRPLHPVPRIAPPFLEAKYPCVNGWTAMWAPPKGAKELDPLLLAQRLIKMEARLLITSLPEDTTLLNKHLVEAVWDEDLLRLQSIFECLCGHPFMLRVVFCVDPIAMKCFEDGSVTSDDLCAPNHLQRITRIVMQAHAWAETPASPPSPCEQTAPLKQGPTPAQYFEAFPPSVIAHIERVIAQERAKDPLNVKEYAAIAAAMEAAAAYPCNRAPDLHRAKTRWQPLLAQYVSQDPVEGATLLDCLQELSPCAAAVSPGGCHAGVLNYVMAYAEGSLQCPPRAPSPPLPPAHEQPPTPPTSPPPAQQHVVVDVHTQDEQDPQAHERPQGGCWGWVCRTVRRAVDWLFGRKKK